MKARMTAVGVVLILVAAIVFNANYNRSDEALSWMKESVEVQREFGVIASARVSRVTKVYSGIGIDGVENEGFTRYVIRVSGEKASGVVTVRQKEDGHIEIFSIEK